MTPAEAEESLGDRLASHPLEKIAVCLGLAVGICVPYFGLQAVPLAPLTAVPETALDARIPFSPAWTFVYLSIAGLVPLAVWLQGSRDELRRYAIGLALLCVPSFVVFAVLPVAGPRPELGPGGGLYEFLVSADRPTNSFPSLHAGLTVYSLRVIHLAAAPGASRGRRLASWIWGAAILYATLATKQHWAVDLAPGIALGWGAAWLAYRGRPARTGELS